jgi:hypothetical protein
MTLKIVTYNVALPIHCRESCWCAYRDGTEEDGVYGWGKTEVDAVIDLIQKEETQ